MLSKCNWSSLMYEGCTTLTFYPAVEVYSTFSLFSA
jgi:hypothetical protein